MWTMRSQLARILSVSRQQELTEKHSHPWLRNKGGPTILHMVPLNEVAAQIGLAHLLNMAHAHIEQVILEVAK